MPINPDAVGMTGEPTRRSWTSDDSLLYALGVGKLLHELGGRIVWAGVPNTLVIGDGDLAWDQVALVEYPSIDAFREMTASAAYQDVHVHREAGLAHQFLINCLSADQAMAALG